MKNKNTENKPGTVHIPDAELEVMQALWQSDKPLLIADIVRNIEKSHKCTKASVHILCDRLAKRGFVSIELVDDGPVAYKKVTALMTENRYRAFEADNIVNKVFRGSWKNLMASLIDAGTISGEELKEISEIVNGRNKGK
ncbi:MAG: BlaI/MecI/CopY family transcriptional regulator [Clostridia bacterium]|nr:BlaI/MecI/CopY family transcriptional regulator [Clostridia bacterium]